MISSGYELYHSMKSISPDTGQVPYLNGLSGQSQNDDDEPFTRIPGSLARTSKRPNIWLHLPSVVTIPLWWSAMKWLRSPFDSHRNWPPAGIVRRWRAPSWTWMVFGLSVKQSRRL